MKTPYEKMFLVPPTLSAEQIDTFVAHVQEVMEKKHGEITAIEKMGVRKTAYPVNKLNSAYYVLLQYKGNGETIHEVERTLKNSDEVFKYLSTKVITKPAVLKPSKKKAEKQAAPVVAKVEAAPKKEVNPVSPSTDAKVAAPVAGNGTQE